MTLKAGPRRLSSLVVGVVAILIGCHKGDSTRQPASPADAKAQIYEYLTRKSGQKEFTPGMDLNLPQRVAMLRSNSTSLEQRTIAARTSLRAVDDGIPLAERAARRVSLERNLHELERAWEVVRSEAGQKQEELSHQEDAYIRSVRKQMAEVQTYEALYRLVGEQLATADGLLADADASRRRTGLKMAREACGHVNSSSVDVWLAARICEAYFWPNLDLADAQSGSRAGASDLLETSRRVFFQTYETNNVVKNYELLMANAPNAHAADTFRVQLADWFEEKGNLKRAAEILNEIRDAEVLSSAKERITRVRDAVAVNP